jgi:hypothetical protein
MEIMGVTEELMALNKDWHQDLQLYDEPHGDEFFLIDTATSPPSWYHLDGTPVGPGKPKHSQMEILQAAVSRGWTPARLYACPPARLVEIYERFIQS